MLAGYSNTAPKKKVTKNLPKKMLKERMQHNPFWTRGLTKIPKIHVRIEHKVILPMSALFFPKKERGINVLITKPCDLTTANKVLVNK